MSVGNTKPLQTLGVGFAVGVIGLLSSQSTTSAQSSANQFHDPATGIVYQKINKTIRRPVIDQRVERREEMVYRPETVTETRPEVTTMYRPITEMRWQPYMEGRWNPFRQPTVAYRQVPLTRWEARNEVVNRTTMKTRWIAEKRTVETPTQIVRFEDEQRVEYEPIARVAPQPTTNGANTAIASRLRPLPQGTAVESLHRSAPAPVTVASNTVGLATSDPPRRNANQSGMRTNHLIPSTSPGAALIPGAAGTSIATQPSFSIRR